jgi:peptidyl-prolyl cis-trans isomerase C
MRSLWLVAAASLLASSNFGWGQSGSPAVAIAATVNGEVITLSELDAALNQNLPVIPLTPAQRKNLRSSLLNDMIDDRLVKQFLDKNAPKVDPKELDEQMKAFVAQLQKENQTLADYLKKTCQTEAQLRSDWAASIQLTNYVQQRATDDQLRAYHAANRDFFDKVEVRIARIIVRTSKGPLPGERATAFEKVQAIRSDLIAGKIDFASAARKYSQEAQGRNGGDLGFVPRRGQTELEEPLVKAAFAMKVGEISDVLETPSGLHLIAVIDRKSGMPTTVEKNVVEVLEAFIDDFRSELIGKLRREAQIKIVLP